MYCDEKSETAIIWQKPQNLRLNWRKPANRARHQHRKNRSFKVRKPKNRTKNWPDPQTENPKNLEVSLERQNHHVL